MKNQKKNKTNKSLTKPINNLNDYWDNTLKKLNEHLESNTSNRSQSKLNINKMNYQNNQIVKSSQVNAFNTVLNKIPLWWGKVDNDNIQNVGDQFSIFFEEDTVWKFEITEIIPNEKIKWKCIEAYHVITGLDNIETEWLDTELIWQFSKTDNENQMQLAFEHKGLTPQLNCYHACNNGWNYFVSSLKLLLETGKGMPNII